MAALQIIRRVAQGDRIILVDHQLEGDLGVTGNEHLLVAAGDQLAGGISAVAFCHIPLGVVGSFDEHIAVRGESDHQLAIDEFVIAHVLVVFLAAVVGAIDEAHQIVVNGFGFGRIGTPVTVAKIPALHVVAVIAIGGQSQI